MILLMIHTLRERGHSCPDVGCDCHTDARYHHVCCFAEGRDGLDTAGDLLYVNERRYCFYDAGARQLYSFWLVEGAASCGSREVTVIVIDQRPAVALRFVGVRVKVN